MAAGQRRQKQMAYFRFLDETASHLWISGEKTGKNNYFHKGTAVPL
jgi:hypothetical protein